MLFGHRSNLLISHGSFGGFPRCISNKMKELSAQCESHPDTYVRYEFPPLLEESRKVVSGLLKAEPSTIVFVPNATIALNTILRSFSWEQGDVILTCDTSTVAIY